ncbi:hypothetical protein Anapl_01527 [Anas platyrhynchos]|uniref:Uncharacterized protein n=1 Tax=Anas platyrhynchos TaxID=8839 RepID=R0LN33_ANAPL|nr:hypothetical protein Anapl_01527 [Anas platyrhynchos]
MILIFKSITLKRRGGKGGNKKPDSAFVADSAVEASLNLGNCIECLCANECDPEVPVGLCKGSLCSPRLSAGSGETGEASPLPRPAAPRIAHFVPVKTMLGHMWLNRGDMAVAGRYCQYCAVLEPRSKKGAKFWFLQLSLLTSSASVGLPGKVGSSVSWAEKHAWTKPRRSFLQKPGNLATINCELQRGGRLPYSCATDMLLLASQDSLKAKPNHFPNKHHKGPVLEGKALQGSGWGTAWSTSGVFCAGPGAPSRIGQDSASVPGAALARQHCRAAQQPPELWKLSQLMTLTIWNPKGSYEIKHRLCVPSEPLDGQVKINVRKLLASVAFALANPKPPQHTVRDLVSSPDLPQNTYNSIFPGLADTTELHPQAPDLPAARKWLFLLKGLRKFIGKGTDRAHRMTGEFTPLSPQLTSGKEGNCKAVLESLRAKEQSFLLLAWFPMMFAVCQHHSLAAASWKNCQRMRRMKPFCQVLPAALLDGFVVRRFLPRQKAPHPCSGPQPLRLPKAQDILLLDPREGQFREDIIHRCQNPRACVTRQYCGGRALPEYRYGCGL